MAHHPLTAPLALILAAALSAAALVIPTGHAAAAQNIGYPVFTGPADPVPAEPAAYTVDGMMRAMYEAEAGGTDFWMDRLLAREGADPSGDQWLMTRGRAALMRTHDPDVLGFGGDLAYYDPTFDRFSNQDGYAITVDGLAFTETVAERRQTPSHWESTHVASGATATVRKFITHNNVAVTDLTLANTGTRSRDFALSVASPFAWQAEGTELTGVLDVTNSRKQPLTTLFPRLSGTGLSPDGGRLTGSLTLAPGESRTVKVQLGLVTREIAESATEYAAYRDASPEEAFATHVRTYNKWWADNVPYFDVPDPAVKKFIYYRWWLMRFNYLDADIPGNDFQFPTSIEGVTGYNNAIALTVPMFIDDLKYLRDPVHSYGPWVSTGESSGGGRFMDNPGDPENWSNSYAQYISEAAWRSYQIHGGQAPIAAKLADYAEGDVKGQLSTFDTDGNGLIEYDWGAMTGNDADAVSFHWREGNLDRAEAAYQYSGAMAAAQAYDTVGDTAKAAEMRAIADRIAQAFLDVLWNPDRRLFEHRHVASGEHVPWKEINNYYPFAVGAIPNEAPYTDALRLFADPAEYPVFPFYTANQRDKQAAAEAGFPGSNNFSQINSTVQFRLYSSVLRGYDTDAITAEDYKKLLYWNAWASFVGGDTRWPDSNEFWADWNPASGSIDYRSWIHHTTLGSSIWTVVEDAAGLRPRNDDKVELSPIDIGWDHFTVNHLRYRDADLTIVWDEPGDGTSHYPGVPEGYSGFVNGERVFTVDSLVPLLWDPATGQVTLTGDAGTVLHSAATPGLKAPIEVEHTGSRLVDVFAKAGAELSSDSANLAAGATATASFTAPGTSTAAAVDGRTVDRPHWGAKGSGAGSDWYALDLGETRTVDEVRLHFYRDRLPGGYTEPAAYRIQYLDGSTWKTIPAQAKDPAVPRANLNRVRFAPVNARHFRVVMDHQDGQSTALKEVLLSATGTATPPAVNTAPYVLARQDFGFSSPSQARLNGVVKDDALPDGGTLTRSWSLVDGPGTAIFADPQAASTVVTFTRPGTYRLRLSAADGDKEASSTVTVEIAAVGEDVNLAPSGTATASYTSPWENVEAINDGIDPPRSNDGENPRWGTWPETGEQWARIDWTAPVRLDAAAMYFLDDGGGVRVPASWRLQYWTGSAFADIPGTYGTAPDRYNELAFPAVTTTAVRAVLQSGQGSVGILKWKLFAAKATSVRAVHQPTLVGEIPELPGTATTIYADGTRLDAPVVWEPITAEDVDTPATSVTAHGVVRGTGLTAEATVHVRLTDAVEVTSFEPEAVTTMTGVAPQLPATALATFNDGSKDNVSTAVTWDPVDPADYAAPGSFTVAGTVAGTSLRPTAVVSVLGPPGADACPDGHSADDPIAFPGADSGVPNRDRGDGCTFLDLVWGAGPYTAHDDFVRSVRSLAAAWRADGLLTRAQYRAVLRAAAKAAVPEHH